MERLTEYMDDGTAQPNCSECEHYKMCGDEYYCDNGKSCYEKIFTRLAKLEDKLESGQLVELLFRLGDEVFVVEDFGCGCLRVEKHTISGYEFGKRDKNTIYALDEYGNHYSEVFYTQPQAEARLKELQEKL